MKLKKSLSEILDDLTVKSTSGFKYSMSRYKGKKGLFDVTVAALTFRDKTRAFELGVYKRTQVKPDSEEYKRLLQQHGHLSLGSDKVVSVPVLATSFEKPEDVLKTLKDLLK